MTGKRPWTFWLFCWKYLSPFALIVILVWTLVGMVSETPTYAAYVGCTQVSHKFLIVKKKYLRGKGTYSSSLKGELFDTPRVSRAWFLTKTLFDSTIIYSLLSILSTSWMFSCSFCVLQYLPFDSIVDGGWLFKKGACSKSNTKEGSYSRRELNWIVTILSSNQSILVYATFSKSFLFN